MFTGIVQSVGMVTGVTRTAAGRRLRVGLGEVSGEKIALGDSICVSGVCLTVASMGKGVAGEVGFDVVGETLKRTTLGEKKKGDRVNLELSLRGDSFVGGHFLQGHVEGVGTVAAVKRAKGDWRIEIAVPLELMSCIVPKGSVAVEGVSMTVAGVEGDRFELAVIPTTLEKTTLGGLRSGDRVNVETDILARTVVHYLRGQGSEFRFQISDFRRAGEAGGAGVTLAKLRELGMA